MSNDGPWQPPFDRPPVDPPPDGRPPYDAPAPAGPEQGRDPFGRPTSDHSWGERPSFDRRRVERPAFDRQRIDRQRIDDAYAPKGGPTRGPEHRGAPSHAAARGRGPGTRPGEQSRWDHDPADDEARPSGSDPDASRRPWVPVAVGAVVLIGAVAAVAVTRSGGGENDPGAAAGGWEAEQYGNSQMLTSDDERACSVSADQLLYCLDPSTGDEVLSRQFYDSVVTSPVLAGDRVLVASSSAGATGALRAVSTEGDDLWELPLLVSSDRQMAVAGDVVAILSGDTTTSELIGVDVETGAERWRVFTAADGTTSRVVTVNTFTDGTRFLVAVMEPDGSAPGGGTAHVVALDPASGAELWRSPALSSLSYSRGITAVAPFEDGSAVALLLDAPPGGVEVDATPRQLVVLDSASGAVRWEQPLASEHGGVAHLDELTIVVDGPDMTAYASDGAVAWTAPAPVGDDGPDGPGPVSLVSEGGHLFAVGRSVHEIDPGTGETALVLDSGTTRDVTVAGNHVVIAGVFAVTAVPTDDLPLGARPVTVVTG